MTSTQQCFSIPKIVANVLLQKDLAARHLRKVTNALTTEDKEAMINDVATEYTQTHVFPRAKVTPYTIRATIVAGLRGETDLFVGKMTRGGWVPLAVVNLGNLTYIEVFPETVTDVVQNNGYICATYGHKGKAAALRYMGEYVPYNKAAYPRATPNEERVFSFTHFSENGLGAINSNRAFNMLRTPQRTKSNGVVANVNIDKHPELELWSRVGDRYGNEVCCFDPKLTQYADSVVYDPNYTDNIEMNHRTEIGRLQEMWGVPKSKAVDRVKKLLVTIEEESIESSTESESEEDAEVASLCLDMWSRVNI